MGEGLPPAFLDTGRDLEIDERNAAIGPEQDVERVQIPDDQTTAVRSVDCPEANSQTF
jgi:hypothetical protein